MNPRLFTFFDDASRGALAVEDMVGELCATEIRRDVLERAGDRMSFTMKTAEMALEKQIASIPTVDAVAYQNSKCRGSFLGAIGRVVSLLVLLAWHCLPASASHVWPILVEKLDMDGNGTVDFELRRGFSYGPGQPPDPTLASIHS